MNKFIKKLLRAGGLELRRYRPDRSEAARLERIFSHNHVDLVLDVGANNGLYGNFIRYAGYTGSIVSFEPLPVAYAQLLEASKNDKRWEIAPRMAIGDTDGEIIINVARNSVSSSILPMLETHKRFAPESGYTSSLSVSIHKLDTVAPPYLADNKTVYLKIDVQGFEQKVLDGAISILPKIAGIQIELSLVPLYDGELLFGPMIEKLKNLGYELYALTPGFTDEASGRLLQVDGIFFQKEL